MTASSSAVVEASEPGRDGFAPRTVAALTGMRGVAAVSVLVVHAAALSPFAWLGLHGFGPVALFVLSGFLLVRPWSRAALGQGPKPSLRTFAVKRVLRIFPPYLACLLVVTLLVPEGQPGDLAGWLRALSLTTIYGPLFTGSPLFHTWSLGTEVSWYLVLPLLGTMVVLSSRRRGRVLVALVFLSGVVVTVGWRWWLDRIGEAESNAGMWLPGWLACFVLGAWIGHLRTAARAGPPSRAAAVLTGLASGPVALPVLAVLFALVANSPALTGGHNFEAVAAYQVHLRFAANTGLALTLLVAAAFATRPTPLVRFLGCRPVEALGRWSYGIYLANLPLVQVLYAHWPHGTAATFVPWLGAIFLVSVLAGAATFALVERPAIDLANRLTQRSTWRRPAGGSGHGPRGARAT